MVKEEEFFDGRIWPNLLDFNVKMDAQLISKSNFLFSASTLILIFILSKVLQGEFSSLETITKASWMVLLMGSFISSLLSLMVILPKLRVFSDKKRVREDIFYYKNISKFYTRVQYADYLSGLPIKNKKVGEAYANQIYNLATNVIPYKFKMLKWSGWTLIFSIFGSILLLLVSLLA